jgi:hypothetical protein
MNLEIIPLQDGNPHAEVQHVEVRDSETGSIEASADWYSRTGDPRQYRVTRIQTREATDTTMLTRQELLDEVEKQAWEKPGNTYGLNERDSEDKIRAVPADRQDTVRVQEPQTAPADPAQSRIGNFINN